MKLKVFQKGFNYSQDGRGNRLIFHLQGCNMHCPWCSNPEGMAMNGVLMTDKEWLSDSCCPNGAVKDKILDRTVCKTCEDMPCTKRRRQKGLRLSYQEMEVDQIVKECVKSRPMFFDGGGVTLTGGEISMQFEAVKELLGKLKEQGIHCAIESNGSHPRMTELIPLVDEWIMDIKHYDDEKHKAWIGISNEQTIKTIREAAQKHGDVLLRIPLIPGFNDGPDDAEGFANLLGPIASRKNVRMELLIYHEFGKGKYEQCGMEYKMKPGRIKPETVKTMKEAFAKKGIEIVHT
ncbi:MAG: glycyl-radical enzyme activating protein [Eubacteriales bacterium]|nr:glycyl-radical enzyme activating protein [Eubacteriales bacterium]